MKIFCFENHNEKRPANSVLISDIISKSPDFNETDLVTCAECKHLVYRKHAQVIIGEGTFCPKHRRAYDLIEEDRVDEFCQRKGCTGIGEDVKELRCCPAHSGKHIHVKQRFFVRVPAHNQEVDRNGKPLPKKRNG